MKYLNKRLFENKELRLSSARENGDDIEVIDLRYKGEGIFYDLYLENGYVVWESRIPPKTYKTLRKEEYPPISDQLDALWKLIQANADKIDLAEAAPLLAAVQEIKNKYPKE
jgi:hypothetical protein